MWNTWREPGIRVPTGPPTPSCHSRYHEWATICTRLTVPRTGMAGLLRLARPGNCVMSAVGVGIGGLVAVHSAAWGEFAWPLLWAGAAAAAFTAGGNASTVVSAGERNRWTLRDRRPPAGRLGVASVNASLAAA